MSRELFPYLISISFSMRWTKLQFCFVSKTYVYFFIDYFYIKFYTIILDFIIFSIVFFLISNLI